MLVILKPRALSARTADSRPGPGLDANFEVLYTIFLGNFTSVLCCNLCSKGCTFPRAFKTSTARGSPGESIPLAISDGHDRVVEGRMYMRNSFRHALFLTFLRTRTVFALAILKSFSYCLPVITSYRRLPCADLTSASIRTSTLTTHRQTFAVTETTIAAKVHQTLDAHGYFTAQIAFDGVLANFVAQFVEFSIAEIFDLLGRLDRRRRADCICAGAADTVDRLKADHSVLVIRDVNPSNTGHTSYPR